MIHTPIQKLEFPNDRGVRLYCKREDLLPFSQGGNKVRIGRAFFRDMQEKNKDCMIIYGNSRSNLCRVLANLCCAEKIPVSELVNVSLFFLFYSCFNSQSVFSRSLTCRK